MFLNIKIPNPLEVALIISLATIAVLAGIIYIQRSMLRDNKIALNQWKQYGVSMKKRIGWSDSHMVTGIKIHDTKTKVWARASHYPSLPSKT